MPKEVNRVKLLRKKHNLTMKELSTKTGIGVSTISNYENGYSTPKKENAKILAEFFGVSLPYLLGLDDNEQILDYSNESLVKSITESIKGRKTLDMLLTDTPYLDEMVDIMDDILNKDILDSYIDFLYSSKYHPAVVNFVKDMIKEKIDDIPAVANRTSDKNSKYHYLWEAWEEEPRRKKRVAETQKKWKEQGAPIFKSWK